MASSEGAHQIQLLRDAFIQAFDEAKKPPSADVPEADRERLHDLRKFKHSLQVFSDCIAISVPLHQEPSSSLAVAATGLFATLKPSPCVDVQTMSLLQRKPGPQTGRLLKYFEMMDDESVGTSGRGL